MSVVRLRLPFLISVLAGALAVGCGQGTLNSPTAPSAVLQSVSPSNGDLSVAFDTAGVAEGLKGGDHGNGKGPDHESEGPNEHGPDAGDHGHENHGELSGFVTAKGTDSITVNGITVKVVADTVIRHGHTTLTLADIEVGDHVQVRGTGDEAGTTLTATEIKVEDTGNDNDDNDETPETTEPLKGTVAGLSGTCPALTFTIGTKTVHTNASTVFDDVTCATLANGNIVEVTGTTQADASILASKVELEAGPDQVTGTISGLVTTATCPVVSFTVGTKTVTTGASTTYTGVTCATLANGNHVEVEGTLSGSTIAAANIELH